MNTSIKDLLSKLLDTAGFTYQSIEEITVADQKVLMIRAEDARSLIGPHGDTIHAIDTLLKKIVEAQFPPKDGEKPERFMVDVNEYRVQQIKDLQARARMMAERARSLQYDVELTPMSAYERLLVHATLSGEENIKTESRGEGRERRIVICYVA